MPYQYSSKTNLFSKLLEIFSFLILSPLFIFNNLKKRKNSRFLLVEPFQMGDILSLTPLITKIKEFYPDSEIYVLTKKSSGGILNFDSRINGVLTTNFPWSDYGNKSNKLKDVFKTLQYVWNLRSYQFEYAFDTRGDIRSQILMLLSGANIRVGYTNYLHSNVNVIGLLLTHKKTISDFKHRYLWNLDLLTVLKIKPNQLSPIIFPSFYPDKLNISENENPNYVIHIGGGWEYKRWDNKKWAELIKTIATDTKNKINVIAGAGEKDILENVKQSLGEIDNVNFKITSFEELITYIATCTKFIGLDSGPMNLAVCLGKPVVSIFGPGDSETWFPLSEGSYFVHKKEKFPCNPCLQKVCYFSENSCMKEVTVSDVMEMLI
jgi:ADP-heptose:LPS heptosyltransferase